MADVILNGPAGRLEARYHQGESPRPPLALVLHPHPRYGGTMNNHVVYRLFHSFRDHGFSVLRFNFRGVGRSEGLYDDGAGELYDAAAAMDWLQSSNPGSGECWVSGFSFGSWVGMQLLMRRPEIAGFISVAPPVNMFDFGFLAPCPASGLVVNGSADHVVSAAEITRLVARLQDCSDGIEHKVIRGANHFFENHLDRLTKVLGDYLTRRNGALTAPAALEKKKPARSRPSRAKPRSGARTRTTAGSAPVQPPAG